MFLYPTNIGLSLLICGGIVAAGVIACVGPAISKTYRFRTAFADVAVIRQTITQLGETPCKGMDQK